MPDNPHHRHLFIAGLHRSGTSLLHAILRGHPEISGFADTGVPEDEGQHLQSVYPIGLMFGGPGRFGFDPRAYMDENHRLATPANAARLMAEWGRYWDPRKPVLMEKTPLNLVRMRFLQALFPQARFLLLLRHPVVVAYATRKWCASPMPMLIEHSLRCYERAVADLPALRHAHVLNYEDLMAQPQATIDAILRFVGVGDFAIDAALIQDSNPRYFAEWQRERAEVVPRGEAWQAGWLARTERRCRALGYGLDDPAAVVMPA
jgi:hypothetical protein